MKVEKFTRSSRCGFVAQWLERATRIRKTLGSIPGGGALCFFFSSDPAVSSSIFVGAEREENLNQLFVWVYLNSGPDPIKRVPSSDREREELSIDVKHDSIWWNEKKKMRMIKNVVSYGVLHHTIQFSLVSSIIRSIDALIRGELWQNWLYMFEPICTRQLFQPAENKVFCSTTK